MSRLFYAVTAAFDSDAARRDYLAWLTGGHAAAVVRGGAESAGVIALDDGRVESMYHFASREAFAAYEAGPAVALREEGRRLFADRGVRFERRTGEVVASA